MDSTPRDRHQQQLDANVHPSDWINPTYSGRYNLVVLGGGTAGLIAAAVAGTLGAKVALIEANRLGGDCLNAGCVPSKGLIRGARAVAGQIWLRDSRLIHHQSGEHSIHSFPGVDVPAVFDRLRGIRAEMSAHDSAMRFRDEFGVDVYLGRGVFSTPRTINVVDKDGKTQTLQFSRGLIATGGRPIIPSIPGIDTIEYLTNEEIFELRELPERLIVLGAGAIGCEIAQSAALLGVSVDVVDVAPNVLPKEDLDASKIVQDALLTSGVSLHLEAEVTQVAPDGDTGQGVVLTYRRAGELFDIPGDRLLVAVGRRPQLDALGLENAAVAYTTAGVAVDRYLRTSNRRIYAAGDALGRYNQTHMAEDSATVVIQNALFARTARYDPIVPRATYTTPEVAQVGLTESEAVGDGLAIDVFRHEMEEVDRALIDGERDGFVKLIVKKGSTKIVGATIVANGASEIIAEIVLAMQNRIGVHHLARVIHPYPTKSEAVKRTASMYIRSKLTLRKKALLERWFQLRR